MCTQAQISTEWTWFPPRNHVQFYADVPCKTASIEMDKKKKKNVQSRIQIRDVDLNVKRKIHSNV